MADAKEKGISEALLRAVERIISGVWWRYGHRRGIDRDDHAQNCWLVLLKAVGQYDGTSNAFTYLTAIFRREAAVLHRAEARHRHEALVDFVG